MSASFRDNGRNGRKNQISPNMILLLVGLFVILPMSGLLGLIWTAIAAVLLIKQAKKQGEDGARRSAPLSPRRTEIKRPAASVSKVTKHAYQSIPKPAPRKPDQHDHIQSTCLNQNGRLEQLETLRKAGLYTNEEYRQKREEILRGK